MAGFLDDATIDVPCPSCGRKQKRKIAELSRNPKIHCSGCGQDIQIKADSLRKANEEITREVSKLRRFGR